jgi:hypothetical protein
MKMLQVLRRGEGPPTDTSLYACPRPDCGVQYAPSTAYFIAPNSGHAESHMTRRVMCPRDGQPMYLTDTNPEKRAFRLWRCPQCDSTRTNEEDLMNKMA